MREIMNDMMDKDDWERMDKGLPPTKKSETQSRVIEMPQIEKQIKLSDIPLVMVKSLDLASRRNITNAKGSQFIGFDVVIKLDGKNEPLKGWMLEGDFLEFRRKCYKIIDPLKIRY